MSYQLPQDVEQLVAEHMRRGTYESADDVLREALRALSDRDDDLAAIRAGIVDMEAGRLVDAQTADAQLRARLGFCPPQ